MALGDKIATRAAYGEALAEFGGKYDIVVMDADLSKSTMTVTFKKKYPERFVNCGIAEGNMFSAAAGIASTGTVVFASTFAMFAAGRSFEQIRNAIGYPCNNVKIGATHAGISVGEDGATHQCCEDIALMRVIPNMTIVNPADAVEARAAVEAAILHKGPVYMRFGRLPVPTLFENDYKFELGKGVQLKDGNDVTIIATGIEVEQSLNAASLLKQDGIDARVINIHTIKPIDKDIIIKAAKETGAIVTAEEHSVIGGLGGAVAEVLSENMPVPVKRIGIQDKFGKSGKPDELLEMYGLTAPHIAKAAKTAIAMK